MEEMRQYPSSSSGRTWKKDLAVGLIVLIFAVSIMVAVRHQKAKAYARAEALFKSGQWTAAAEAYAGLSTYRDSKDKVIEATYHLKMEQGRRAQEEQAYEVALNLFNEARSLLPSNPEVSNAIRHCEQEWKAARKSDARQLLIQARDSMNAGDYEAASTAYEQAGSLDPDVKDVATKGAERAREIAEEEAERERLMGLVDGDRGTYRKMVRLVKEHPDWEEDMCACIAKGRVRIGMTSEQATVAWGQPDDINRTSGSFGVHEQWVYGELDANYLYFEDGILTTIQN